MWKSICASGALDRAVRNWHRHAIEQASRRTRRKILISTQAVTFGVFKHSSPNTGLVYRDCIWSLHIQRDPTYYIFKGAVPIYVIVAFAFFQFAMDVDAQLTERLNFLVALMLSSFAIQWTATDRLPLSLIHI